MIPTLVVVVSVCLFSVGVILLRKRRFIDGTIAIFFAIAALAQEFLW